MEAAVQTPAVPATSGGRTLKLIWRVIVGLQAAVAGLALAFGLILIDAGSSGDGPWLELSKFLGWILVATAGFVLVWSGLMLFASFKSNVWAGVMGIVQGGLWLLQIVTVAVEGGVSNAGALSVPVALALAWIWLCSTFRRWPDQ